MMSFTLMTLILLVGVGLIAVIGVVAVLVLAQSSREREETND